MAELIILLPLVSSIICGLLNKVINTKVANLISTFAIGISAILAANIFYAVAFQGEIIHKTLFVWLAVDQFHANWSIYIDKLSALMILVVTSVSAVVHIYSVGYMHDEKNAIRFMSYLSLFTVCMLILVTADNFLQLFFGWEGVGACSYLLIGFWYHKPSAINASLKAFIVNRVGDLAFILGIFVIFTYFDSIEFSTVFAKVSQLKDSTYYFMGENFSLFEVISLLLFVGCMGKSAQIGLHIWLPDAMEGPTPVSALIHAATMVTAGVFLMARCSYIFEYAPNVKLFITIIGGVTAVFASIVAVAQSDIKKIIAYSTCSQLGYMFLAAGISHYHASIFHLFTHAYFKALLFLAAGSVIHSINEQDVNKMGGLKKFMPITFIYFIFGSLAITGIIPFAGHFSKDMIIEAAYLSPGEVGRVAFYLSLTAVFFTSLYSTKILVKVFMGSKEDYVYDPHESPAIMNLPLTVLLFGAIFAGIFGQKILGITLHDPSFFDSAIHLSNELKEAKVPALIVQTPLIITLIGFILGYVIYSSKKRNDFAVMLVKPLQLLAKNKFYFDEIYQYTIVKLCSEIAKISSFFDKRVIDFVGPTFAVRFSNYAAKAVAVLHNGYVNNYALMMLLGLVYMLLVLVIQYIV